MKGGRGEVGGGEGVTIGQVRIQLLQVGCRDFTDEAEDVGECRSSAAGV